MEHDDWITTAEAAERSGYHPHHVRALVREGKIVGRKFGIVWQISRASLDEYLQQVHERGEKTGPKPKLLTG